MSNINSLCKRLKAAYRKIDSDYLVAYDGASESEISDLNDYFGGNIPDQLVQFLQIVNGQPESHKVFHDVRLLGVRDIIECSETNRGTVSLIEHWMGWDTHNAGECAKTDLLWRDGWIPFARHEDNSVYLIDTDPSDDGTVGQILSTWPSGGYLDLVADDLEDWLSKVLRPLKKRDYDYSDGILVISDGDLMEVS